MRLRAVALLLLAVTLLLLAACGGRGTAPAPTVTVAAPTPVVEAPTPTAEPPTPDVATVVQAVSPITLPPTGTNGYPWWNDTVWYEIFVRSFYDSDGDGIGDLQGLIRQLDYLNDGDPTTTTDLGVTGIWLMPIMPSPSYHGYDVVDYYGVNPEYGTEEDFKQLMAEAHRRGIRVIVDMVINHTSSQHPWFKAARAGDPEYEGWYRFVEGERPVQFAPWGGGNIWHPAGADRYYYGLYWGEMPDLNFENPAVTEEVQNIARFWLEEMGVDGFRLDGVAHLIESGRQVANTPETREWLVGYRDFVHSVKPDAVLVGEVWYPTDQIVPYIGEGLDLAFEFDTANAILSAARGEQAGAARISFAVNRRLYPPLQYAPFLSNHDEPRAFTVLQRNMDHAHMAAAMLLTGPGSPVLYYGEEVAVQGSKPDEDLRKPMPWTGEPTGGFTTGRAWRGMSPGHQENNVAAMDEEPDSLLNHYRTLIHLRNQHEALRVGDYLALQSSIQAIFPFIRQSDNQTLLVLHNLTGQPVSGYTLSLQEGAQIGSGQAVDLLSGAATSLPALTDAGGFANYTPLPTLEPYTSYVIQLRP